MTDRDNGSTVFSTSSEAAARDCARSSRWDARPMCIASAGRQQQEVNAFRLSGNARSDIVQKLVDRAEFFLSKVGPPSSSYQTSD